MGKTTAARPLKEGPAAIEKEDDSTRREVVRRLGLGGAAALGLGAAGLLGPSLLAGRAQASPSTSVLTNPDMGTQSNNIIIPRNPSGTTTIPLQLKRFSGSTVD